MNHHFFSSRNLSLLKCRCLTSEQLSEASSLFRECSAFDPYSYDSYINPEEEGYLTDCYYLCYATETEENHTLIGFLAILAEDEESASVHGYIKPSYRQQHIFTEMVNAAFDDDFCVSASCIEYHLPDEAAVPAFVVSLLSKFSFRFSHHEYYMQYDLTDKTMITADISNHSNADHLITAGDAAALHIICDASEEDLMIRIFSGAVMIGSAMLYLPADHPELADCPRVFFHAFEIMEDYRHKGLGRQSFLLILQMLRQLNCQKLCLHVSGRNKTAHRLYVSCGLEVTSSFSMYLYP